MFTPKLTDTEAAVILSVQETKMFINRKLYKSLGKQLFLTAMKSLKIYFCIDFYDLGRHPVANKAVFQVIF